ncbi:MAG: HAD family hydrolase [Chloroflexi bacterium]|nr:HAD family hydrolase [Chloroflexota bacterium]
MEIINNRSARAPIRVAIFDFDGTLSLLRSGWTQIMHALMFDELSRTPRHEDAAALDGFITDLIYSTSGQQTIYQMIRLAEEVEKRGGAPDTPQAYLQNFSEQLVARVNARIIAIESGANTPADWLIPGTLEFLQALAARGITCYIVSGTGENFVRDEAALLGIAPYFAGIFGAHADYKNHSKKIVIGKLVAQHALQPGELVTFGDGAPEIADTKAVGGVAIGLATDEEKRAGIHPQKRAVLVQAGADVIAPDFCDRAALIEYLWYS